METQWEDLWNTVAGKQNFCIIEKRKAPVSFNFLRQHVTSYDVMTLYRIGQEGPELCIGASQFIDAYLSLLSSRDEYTRYEFQIAMGTLLGYDIESCIEYARSDPFDCSCSKCGGPKTDADVHRHNVWVQNDCPHPLREDKVQCDNWEPTMEDGPQELTYKGKPYGKLMPVDHELVANSPGIQPWSRAIRPPK